MTDNNFTNKTVIITGASAGVGAATANKFADLGANLVIIARGKTALNKIAEQLAKKTTVVSYALDVTDQQGCINVLKEVEQQFGHIDVLINNAGYHQRGDVINNRAEDLAQMVDVNLKAPIEWSALVLPYLINSRGAIVNVGSLAGRTPLQGAATYSATKAGLRAFSYALADEIRNTGVTVGIVSPGPIDTGFIMSEIDQVEDIVFSQPMSSPEQVAQAIVNIAKGEQAEISMPTSSGWLTTLSYLFPWLRRKLRPALYRKGAKAKANYVEQYKKFQ